MIVIVKLRNLFPNTSECLKNGIQTLTPLGSVKTFIFWEVEMKTDIQTILQAIRLTPPKGVCTSIDWEKQRQVAKEVNFLLEIKEAVEGGNNDSLLRMPELREKDL